MADSIQSCSDCGATLSGLSPLGLCPACLVDSAAFPDEETSITGDELEHLGTVIDRYKLLEVIGEGGFGVVYMAEQREPVRRMVALKVIKLGMDTKQVIARFESERQALALMEHPNIARVHDAGATVTGRPYFVMELVRGIPIDRFCDEHQLGTRERLQLFLGVCSAIQHAHQKGIIHRDLKPSNVLVAIDDDGPSPKVIDFGIAKATAAQRLTDLTVFTQFHQFLGTPAYTSPEQAQFDARDVDTRSDIYSLGVLLYTLLTGQTPLDQEALVSKGQDAVFKAIREEEPPRPSTRINALTNAQRTSTAALRKESPNQLSSHLRGDLDKVVMKAMEKDRRRRYETANSFALDIQRYLDNEPVTAVAPNTVYRVRKWVRRNRGLALATAVVFTAVIVGFITSLFQARRAEAGELAARENALAARKNLYLADMNVVHQALESGNVDRARMILERHIPKKGEEDVRIWEWRYFWGQAHREIFSVVADDDPNDNVDPDPIYYLAISPKGDLMASAASNGTVRVWNLATRQELFQIKCPRAQAAWVDFSPNAKLLTVTGSSNDGDRSDVVVWDVIEKQETHRFTIAASSARVIEPTFLSNDDICFGASDGALWFWNVTTNENASVTEHRKGLRAVSVARDSNRIVSTDRENRILIWDAELRRVIQSFYGPSKQSLSSISSTGRWVATYPLFQPRIHIYDGKTTQFLHELPLKFPNHGAWFSPDETLLATAEFSGTIRLLETDQWEERQRYQHRGHQLNTLAFSPDHQMIVSGGDNGIIMGWPGKLPGRNLLASQGVVVSVEYSPDGRLLGIGLADGALELWDANQETLLHTTAVQTEGITWINGQPLFDDDFFAFSPDSRQFAVTTKKPEETGDHDFAVDLFDTHTFQKQISYPHPHRIYSLSYSPDGRYLATGTHHPEGIIRLWDLATHQELRIISQKHAQVMCLAFSSDSKYLVSEGWGPIGFWVWDVETGEKVATLKEHIEPRGDNQSALFSPDGKLLATAGYDRQVILWDTKTWRPVRSLLGHSLGVFDLSFSPNGKRLASSGADNQCRVWDVETGQEVANFSGFANDFSADGNALAVGGALDFTQENKSPGATEVRIYRGRSLNEIDETR